MTQLLPHCTLFARDGLWAVGHVVWVSGPNASPRVAIVSDFKERPADALLELVERTCTRVVETGEYEDGDVVKPKGCSSFVFHSEKGSFVNEHGLKLSKDEVTEAAMDGVCVVYRYKTADPLDEAAAL